MDEKHTLNRRHRCVLSYPWCDARHERCRSFLRVNPSERVRQASVRLSVLVLCQQTTSNRERMMVDKEAKR